jgi:tripartite-type tricarboxylate transporter receptor subunit TctC
VLPFPPGGPSDIVMRLAAEKMQTVLKQPVVIDNKPGAGGNPGQRLKSPGPHPTATPGCSVPDSLITVNPHVYKTMPFKPDDLVPLTIGTQFNQTLVCNPALGVKTVAALIAKAKAESLSTHPGAPACPGHLSMELAAVDGRGSRCATSRTRARRRRRRTCSATRCRAACWLARPCCRTSAPASWSRSAVSGSRRSPTLPEVPTLAEAGVPGYKADWTLVMFAPKGVPEPIATKFRQAFVDAVTAPDVVEKLKAGDQTAVGSTPAEATAMLAAGLEEMGRGGAANPARARLRSGAPGAGHGRASAAQRCLRPGSVRGVLVGREQRVEGASGDLVGDGRARPGRSGGPTTTRASWSGGPAASRSPRPEQPPRVRARRPRGAAHRAARPAAPATLSSRPPVATTSCRAPAPPSAPTRAARHSAARE